MYRFYLNDRSDENIYRSTIIRNHSFLFIMINYECYCDGAYSSNREQGGIGIVFIRNGIKVFEYSNGYKNTTNNRMEIRAVLNILKCFNKPVDSITIYTDSMYVIGCATLGWKRNKNSDLWKIYEKEFKRVSELCSNITFKHVKGHSDNYWNNYVDKLAVDASQMLL